MRPKLIVYECIASDHRPDVDRADKLTIHEGAWAYCPFDARADGHAWRDTGGIDVDEVARRSGLSALPSTPRGQPPGVKAAHTIPK